MDLLPFIHEIRDATNLVELVAEKVTLKKTGGSWQGACPIHGGGTRTACLSIWENDGHWRCHSCGESGDAIDWLQKTESMTFQEAVEFLAKKAGISLPKQQKKGDEDTNDRLFDVILKAQEFYTQQIKKNLKVIEYLEKRGISYSTIEDEGIGYAPAGWDITLKQMESLGITFPILEQAGLARRNQTGSHMDFFRNRITLPIRDQRGRVVAFGARNLPDAPPESPKYINSPETPIFHKSKLIYGLHKARGVLKDNGAVIVEGYFDVLSLWQAGITQAVAPMGTALTETHISTLHRWTNRITLMFDGDPAGERATEKALSLTLAAGFDVRLYLLPKGQDPDNWVRANGKDVKQEIAQAPDWIGFRMEKALKDKDLRLIEDRLSAAKEVGSWIAYLPPERREEVRCAVAHELHLPTDSIKIKQLIPKKDKKGNQQTTNLDRLIASLIDLITKGSEYLDWVKLIPKSYWENRKGAALLETIIDSNGNFDNLSPEAQNQIHSVRTIESEITQPEMQSLYLELETDSIKEGVNILAHNFLLAVTPAIKEQIGSALMREKNRVFFAMRGPK